MSLKLTEMKHTFLVSPLKAEIVKFDLPLIAGKQYKITCRSEGGSPSVAIVWFVEGKPLEGQETEVKIYLQRKN